MQTKITELLDSKNIKYRLLPHEKEVFTCEEAAKQRKIPLNEMIKCILLVDGSFNYYLACVPADKKINTKKIQELMNCSRLSFASKEEIKDVLGYEMGAIPPLLLKTKIPIIFDNKIKNKEKINISSGDPKTGLELSPNDLISLVNPKFENVGD